MSCYTDTVAHKIKTPAQGFSLNFTAEGATANVIAKAAGLATAVGPFHRFGGAK